MVGIHIDADIARSAGFRSEDDSPSCKCREFLEEIRERRIRVIFTDALLSEWRVHRSKFSNSWLTGMFARRCVEMTVTDDRLDVRNKVAGALPTDSERQAAEKDMHLILGALNAGNRIASRDKVARQLFAGASILVREIAEIMWVDPCDEQSDALDWIAREMPVEEALTLREYRP